MIHDTGMSPDGYTVVNADQRDRSGISNSAGADVYLSLHVNAGGGHSAEILRVWRRRPTLLRFGGTLRYQGGRDCAGDRVYDSDDLQMIEQYIDKFAPLIALAFCEFYGVAYPAEAPQAQNGYLHSPEDAHMGIVALGALHTTPGDFAVQAAPHYASEELRVASGKLVAFNRPVIDRVTAQKVVDHLGTTFKYSVMTGMQEAAQRRCYSS